MDVTTRTRTERGHRTAVESRYLRVRLAREPGAAAIARCQVRAAIQIWGVPVDTDVAMLLTSDLVTNAILLSEGEKITLAIRCVAGRLRVELYDTWRALAARAEPGTAREPGLALVVALADEWGTFRTPAGMAVYFALDCE